MSPSLQRLEQKGHIPGVCAESFSLQKGQGRVGRVLFSVISLMVAKSFFNYSLLLAFLTFGLEPAAAQSNTKEAAASLASELSGELMSPYCPGRTISHCPSPSARELRIEIESWSEAGQGREEIIGKLEERYGSGIYASPKSGAGSWLKYGPALILVLFSIILFLGLRSLRVKPPEEESI